MESTNFRSATKFAESSIFETGTKIAEKNLKLQVLMFFFAAELQLHFRIASTKIMRCLSLFHFYVAPRTSLTGLQSTATSLPLTE